MKRIFLHSKIRREISKNYKEHSCFSNSTRYSSSILYQKALAPVLTRSDDIPTKIQRRCLSTVDFKFKGMAGDTDAAFTDFSFKTLTEMLEKTCEYHGKNPLFGIKKGTAFEWITFDEFHHSVKKTRTVLQSFKLEKNNKVALISNNRWEWAAVAYATMGLGGQIVPMYEAQLESDWQYILQDSGTKVLVVSTEKIYEIVKEYNTSKKIGKIQTILCLDAPADKPHSLQYWLNKVDEKALVPTSPNITEDDVATIIYTSGTTGKPKGVELTHRNISTNILGLKSLLKAEMGRKVSLAFLPWAHVFGQVNELHTFISTGSSLAIVPHRDQLLECIQIVKPTALFSVPIMLNKIYDGIMKGVKQQSFIKRSIFKLALRVARKRNHKKEYGQPVSSLLEWQFQLFDRIVFSKVRERLGGRVQRVGAGGAAAGMEVLHFFEDIGLSVIEGYGLTETSPVVTAGSVDWEYRRLGCVGVPIHGIDVKIVDPTTLQPVPNDTDGEITVSGPIVMKGYHNNPQATEEVFFTYNNQRYFRTGDLGRLVEGKFLKITGRIKEQFKLENGKFVVPAPLEDIFSRGPFIAQSFLYGVNRPYTILFVVPNYQEWSQWANSSFLSKAGEGGGNEGAKRSDKKEIAALLPKDIAKALPSEIGKNEDDLRLLQQFVQHPAFIRKVTKEIVKHSKLTKSYERPVYWVPIIQPFTPENQMLTPKLSLRRNNVVKAYDHLLQSIYEGKTGHQITYEKDKTDQSS